MPFRLVWKCCSFALKIGSTIIFSLQWNFNLYMQRFVRVRVNIFLENSDISTYRKLHVVPVNPNDREFIKN